jgi:quercetin dioxygenase-like cupin family protein
MNGKFTHTTEVEREQLPFGEVGWISRPTSTNAKELVVIEGSISPGFGHNFPKHPDQEEVFYVLEGEVEQWLEQDKRELKPGDSAFIPAGLVHASFNLSGKPVKVLAILAPCVTAAGYASVEVGDQEPWKSLR